VEKELVGGLAQVPGKQAIFRKMVTAAVERPDGVVRQVLYPVVPGGEKTLRTLARHRGGRRGFRAGVSGR
jgi:hypothetical protein